MCLLGTPNVVNTFSNGISLSEEGPKPIMQLYSVYFASNTAYGGDVIGGRGFRRNANFDGDFKNKQERSRTRASPLDQNSSTQTKAPHHSASSAAV